MNKSYFIYIINQYISQSISRVVPEGHRRTPSYAGWYQDVDDEGDVQAVPGADQEGSMIAPCCLFVDSLGGHQICNMSNDELFYQYL